MQTITLSASLSVSL